MVYMSDRLKSGVEVFDIGDRPTSDKGLSRILDLDMQRGPGLVTTKIPFVSASETDTVQNIVEADFGRRIPRSLITALGLDKLDWAFKTLSGRTLPLLFCGFPYPVWHLADSDEELSIANATAVICVNRELLSVTGDPRTQHVIPTSLWIAGLFKQSEEGGGGQPERIVAAEYAAATDELLRLAVSRHEEKNGKKYKPISFAGHSFTSLITDMMVEKTAGRPEKTHNDLVEFSVGKNRLLVSSWHSRGSFYGKLGKDGVYVAGEYERSARIKSKGSRKKFPINWEVWVPASIGR